MYLKKIDVRIFSIQSWEDLKGLTALLLPPQPLPSIQLDFSFL